MIQPPINKFPILSAIVAVSENNVIGDGKDLLWHLPNDIKRFKDITWGFPIIMGRKTYESIGKPLPGRLNIVLSRTLKIENKKGIIQQCYTKEDAITFASEAKTKEVFIIGGGKIYNLFKKDILRLYITKVQHKVEGKTTFMEWNSKEWEKVYSQSYERDNKHIYAYSFENWIRN